MANPIRGSVPLQAGDACFTLSFSINALCELEDVFGVPAAKIGKIFEDEESASIRDVRKLIMCGLHDHHPDIDLTKAGMIATDAGIPACMEAITRAFELAFPEASGATKNPRTAKGSTR